MPHINVGNEWLNTMKLALNDKELSKIYRSKLSLISRLVNKHIRSHKLSTVSIVDLGGADGQIIAFIKERLPKNVKAHVTAIDSNKELLLANKSADKIIIKNLLKPLGGDSYDIGIMRYVLNYNTKPNQLLILKNIFRSMKQGGVFINQWCGVYNTQHQRKFQRLFNTQEVTKKLYRKDSYWPTWQETAKALNSAGFKTTVVEKYKLPIKNLYKIRYGLSDAENQKILDFLGVQAFIYYTIFEAKKML